MLDVSKVYASGSNAWDTAVHDASEEYKHRMVINSFVNMSFIYFISQNRAVIICSRVFSKAQPLLWQLSLTCCHGSESDAIWKQYLMEHGQPLPPRSDPRKACQVRGGNVSAFGKYFVPELIQLQQRWLSCCGRLGESRLYTRVLVASFKFSFFHVTHVTAVIVKTLVTYTQHCALTHPVITIQSVYTLFQA